MNRLTEVKDALNGSTKSTYDLNGNLLSITDAKGQATSYIYNSRNQVVTVKDQLGKTQTYEHDINGNLLKATDRKGQITTNSYNSRNRLKRSDYTDGSYTENTYDAVGRLISINDSVSGRIDYVYSSTGCSTCGGGVAEKVIQETTPLGTINYTYDALGRRTSMTVSGQPTVNYQYDANSSLIEINSLINGVSAGFSLRYDSLRRRTSLTYPNGVTTNYSYDNASRVLSLEHLNPLDQILESINYMYDANGSRTDTQRANFPVKLPDSKPNITFNSANQMLTFNDKSMTYDENGNLISLSNSCGITNYTWDTRNRLVAINGFNADCSQLIASFKYDALGKRIENTINGRTVQYIYDGVDIIQEIENGAVSATYVRTLNIDEPLARLTPNTSRFYQTDALGSVIALTDEIGSTKTQYIYDPYGNVTISGDASDNPFQYTGRENDGTGLYYYRARYYSPELQRFIREDPIGMEGGINLYAYVQNNPTSFIDPTGLAIWICIRKAVGVPGNHVYFWDDRSTTSRAEKSCGRNRFWGGPASGSSNDKGPPIDVCNKVQGSDGREGEIMDCCKKLANYGPWFPWINDCFTSVDRCIESVGLPNPGAPGGRVGDPCDPCRGHGATGGW